MHGYNARYYSAVLGRFVSADTVVPDFGNPQDLNRYAYSLNNPVKYIDPSGHAPICGQNCQPEAINSFDPPSPPEPKGLLEGWYLAGFRGEASFMASFVGVDFNVDMVSFGWKPDESSVIVNSSVPLGLGLGFDVNGGPILTRDTHNLDEYKTIDNSLGATIADDTALGPFSFEPDFGWSDDAGFSKAFITGDAEAPHSFFLGVAGVGTEASGWYAREYVSFDIARRELKVGTGDYYLLTDPTKTVVHWGNSKMTWPR